MFSGEFGNRKLLADAVRRESISNADADADGGLLLQTQLASERLKAMLFLEFEVPSVLITSEPVRGRDDERMQHAVGEISAPKFFIVQSCIKTDNKAEVKQWLTTSLSRARRIERWMQGSQWIRILEIRQSPELTVGAIEIDELAPETRETRTKALRDYLAKYFWGSASAAADSSHGEPR